jgi:hypothetical protein
MQCPSPPHGRKGLHAVPWHGAARWLFVLACGLLLTLISAAPARAATALPNATAVDSIAPGPAHATAESPAASHTDQVLDRQSDRGSNTPEPTDSRDLIEEEEDDRDDDDGVQDPRERRTSQLSIEEILGQRSPSRTSEAPISPDGSSLATPYLTESVRRL